MRVRKGVLCGLALLMAKGLSAGTVWDAGAGTANTSINTPSNWDSDALPAFTGSAYVTFGTGGTTATVNTAASFLGIAFNIAGNFTVANGTGTLTLGSGGIAAYLPSTTSHTYTLAEDVTLAANQSWGVTNNGAGIATLAVSGTLADGASSFGITKSGSGPLVLSGNNSYDGATTVKTGGIIRISHVNALGSTNGATVVENGAWLEVSGDVTVAEALTLNGDQASGYAGALRSTGGSNTWSGALAQGSMTRIGVTSGSLDVTGGFIGSQGLAISQSGGTTLRLSNKPFVMSSATLYAHGAGLLILNVTGNTWGTLEVAGGTVRTDMANVLSATATLQLNPNAVVDLNGNSQAVGQFKNASTNAGSRLVTSAAPATLTVSPSGVTNTYDGRLAGALSLIKNGTGTLILAGTNILSGSVTVSNGTLTVAAPSSLGSSMNVAVDGGTLELQTASGITNTANLRVANGGAKVNLATGLVETVGQLYLGGVAQEIGTYGSSGSGAQNIDDAHFAGGGQIRVLNRVDYVWDGGGAADTRISTAANWLYDALPPFNGSTNAVFGAGGGTATVDTAVSFLGLRFNRDADFTLAGGAGALTLGTNGIVVTLPSATSRTYTVSADLTLAANQIWSITNNDAGSATLTVSGAVADGASAFGITKSGDGLLVLSGNNSYDGATVVRTGGILRVISDHALGSMAGGTTVEKGGRLELNGDITVAEPVSVSGEGLGNGGVLNSTGANRLSGLITMVAGSARINCVGGSSRFTISGGVTSAANSMVILNTGGGTIQVINKPITIGTSTLWSDQTGTLILGSVSNTWGSTVFAQVAVRVDAANVFPLGTSVSLSRAARLDLNGFSQTFNRLDCTDASGTDVSSATPATLTLNQTADTTFDGSLSGALALVKGGSSKLTLTGSGNRFSGAVTVSNGTLTVASASCLGSGTNVTVAGGTLELQTEHGIRNNATLSIAGGAKVSVAAGLTERAERLVIGGVPQTNGTWGAAGSGADHIDSAHFSGSGKIRVEPAAAGMISEYFVAADGGATNAGTRLSPFATLEQARAALRLAQQDGGLPAGGVCVWLRGGIYARTNTFDLTSADSGAAAAPVAYRAYPGETVRIHGAKLLPPEWFTAVTNGSPVWARLDASARGHVMQADLAAHGVTDFGTLRKRGFGSSSTLAAAELFFDGAPQQLARWPDVGETGAEATNGFVYTVNPTTSMTFTYSGSRPARWGQAEELWFHGFWMELWADDHVQATTVNTNSRQVTLTMAPGYGITNNMPYYAENLLEEITRPGEWYLNRSTGVLYFWPPAGPAGHETYLSMLEAPLVRLTGVQQVTLRDITFEMTRGDLLAITGGDNDRVLGCRLSNAGNYAVKISGSRNGVCGCEIANPGDGGIVLSGGDRATLTGAGNFVRNCTVHGFGRWSWMYTPAVNFSGVGQTVTHNLFYDSPHTAVLFGSSNYQLVELNEVRDVCKWSSDAGSIYTGRDLGAHGTLIRNNFIHNIAGQFSGGYGTHGIYLDDCVAGIEVFGNICYNVSGMGIQHGGGRDDLLENNVLVKCGRAMGADARGLTWDMQATWENLQALPYRGTIWSNAFPQLVPMPTDWATVVSGQWLAPRGTVFSRNIGYSNAVWVSNGNNATSYYREVANNLTNSNPLFVNEANSDLTLRTNSPAFTIPSFLDIPFHRIGPEPDTLKELAAWDFPTAADRTGFSAEALVAPGVLTVSGMSCAAAPGHPTWAVSVPYAEMNATNESGAVASGDYFETALAPLAQQHISLATVSFDHRKSGGSTGATLFVRSSTDGYVATLGSAITTGSNVWNTSTFTLSGVAKLQDRSAPITLRIYCYRPANDPGTQSVSIDTISVKGAVQTEGGSRVATVFMVD